MFNQDASRWMRPVHEVTIPLLFRQLGPYKANERLKKTESGREEGERERVRAREREKDSGRERERKRLQTEKEIEL